jgi:multiple sugar transport system permease protein
MTASVPLATATGPENRPQARSTPPRPFLKSRLGRDWKIGWTFVIPFLAFFVVFTIVPVLFALWQSVHDAPRSGLGFEQPKEIFVGLDNFVRAIQDQHFIESAGRVALYGVVQVPVMLGLALVMALIFDAGVVKLRSLFQVVAFLPYAIPGVIASIVWAFLYLPGISPVVEFLHGLAIPVDFLAPGTVLWSIANVATWQWTGYNMIIVFASLQALPQDIFEAARIDGAGKLQIAWRIKVPLVTPALIITGLFSVVGTLQLFSEPMVLRSLTGNVTYDYTPNMMVYNLAFGSDQRYAAAAFAVVIAVVSFVLSFGFLRLLQRRTL